MLRRKKEAKANNTYIVYETENRLVKEYPDEKIIEFDKKTTAENQ